MGFTPEEVARIRKQRAGYLELNRIEVDEMRRLTPEQSLRDLAILMQFARRFPRDEHDEREIEEVRNRWLRLKDTWRKNPTSTS